jgi:hypothetical protein
VNLNVHFARKMTFPRNQSSFVIAVDSCSPSDVLKDYVSKPFGDKKRLVTRSIKALLACMHRFFRKGTVLECCRILPQEFEPDELFKCTKFLRAPVQATPQPHQLQNATASPEEYFRLLIPYHEKRFKRLIKVAQCITNFQHGESVDSHRVYNAISIPETPIARAEAIFERIMSKQDTRTYRYNLLYFSNAVDQYNSLQLEVSQGRSNKSVAFDTISKGDKKKREIARRTYADACRYLELLETGGPGSLLSMNATKSE